LNVNCIGLQFLKKKTCAVSESGGRVGAADECESALCGWIGECGDGIIEGVEAIGDSVVYVAINVGISKESVDNLSAATHKLINANRQQK